MNIYWIYIFTERISLHDTHVSELGCNFSKFLISNTYSKCYVHLSVWLGLAGYRKVRVVTKMVRDDGKWPVSSGSLTNIGLMASPLLSLATEWFPERVLENLSLNFSFVHSFLWHVQNETIPCRSQELLPFLSVMYFFPPPFTTNYSSILSHLIFPTISWSTSQFFCSQIHI